MRLTIFGFFILAIPLSFANAQSPVITLKIFDTKSFDFRAMNLTQCGVDKMNFHDQLCFEQQCFINRFPGTGSFKETDGRFMIARPDDLTVSLKFRRERIPLGKLIPLRRDEKFFTTCRGADGRNVRMSNSFTLYLVKLHDEIKLDSIKHRFKKRLRHQPSAEGSLLFRRQRHSVLKLNLDTPKGNFRIYGEQRLLFSQAESSTLPHFHDIKYLKFDGDKDFE